MDFRLTPEQEEFRKGFVAWLEKNLPSDFDPARFRNYDSHEDWARAYKKFQRDLWEAGYAGCTTRKSMAARAGPSWRRSSSCKPSPRPAWS